jgi:preprotein translocase subunit SecE
MNDQGTQSGVSEAAESARLIVSVALVLGGIVAFYALHAQADWIRWLSVVAGVVLAAVVFGTSARGRDFWQFMLDARLELRKVVWPNRQETVTTTAAVFMFVIAAGVFFWLLDVFLSWATRLLTGQGG